MEEKYKQIATLQRDYDLLLNAYKGVCGSERTLCLENEQLKQKIDELYCLLENEKKGYKNCQELRAEERKELKQQLAEKEELLKNAIIVKFDIGDEVFYIDNQYVIGSNIISELSFNNRLENKIVYRLVSGRKWYLDTELFLTKAEAQQKLKELGLL